MSSSSGRWVVHKFGGTSVENADRYLGVLAILKDEIRDPQSPRQGVVVSAMKGTTDGLIDVVGAARRNEEGYLDSLKALKRRHEEAVAALGISSLNAVLDKIGRASCRERVCYVV